jgi:RNA polymerase sigma factor (sigma-70 family)
MNQFLDSGQIEHYKNRRTSYNNQSLYFEKAAYFKEFNNITEKSLSKIKVLNKTSTKQVLFAKHVYLVKRAVYIYFNTTTFSDLLDLYQEGLLYLWGMIDLFSDNDNGENFLGKRIRNRLKVARRRQLNNARVLPKLINQGVQLVEMPYDMPTEIDNIQIPVREAIDDLSAKQRSVMLQFYGVGERPLKVAEIAAKQGKTPRTIRKLRKCGEDNLAKNQKMQALRSLVF